MQYLEFQKYGEVCENTVREKLILKQETKHDKKVCIYWSHNIIQAGTYTAEMYQEGYLLGMTSFELK